MTPTRIGGQALPSGTGVVPSNCRSSPRVYSFGFGGFTTCESHPSALVHSRKGKATPGLKNVRGMPSISKRTLQSLRDTQSDQRFHDDHNQRSSIQCSQQARQGSTLAHIYTYTIHSYMNSPSTVCLLSNTFPSSGPQDNPL